MNDEVSQPDSMFGAALQVLREHGLVVIALAALAWQVYFLGGLLDAQNERWSMVIEKVSIRLEEDIRERMLYWKEVSGLLAKFDQELDVITKINSDMEEECLIKNVTKDPLTQPEGN